MSIYEIKIEISNIELLLLNQRFGSSKFISLMEFRAHLKNLLIHTLEVALDDALHSQLDKRRSA